MAANLFEMALRNAPSLETDFHSLRSALETGEAERLGRFAQQVHQHGRISINMVQSDLNSFLVFGRHENTYEWARIRAEESSKPVAEILRDRLKEHYERRVAFDSYFEDGEGFRYGALNIGGAGATHFGDLCAVFTDQFASTRRQLAYLRSDSAKTYVISGPAVDEAAIQRDAAPHSHRQYLAAVKHAQQAVRNPEATWPLLVCSKEDFIEAIFAGDATRSDLESVRMPRSEHDLRFEFAYEDFRAKLNYEERAVINDFVQLKRLLKQHNIPLEVVDDA